MSKKAFCISLFITLCTSLYAQKKVKLDKIFLEEKDTGKSNVADSGWKFSSILGLHINQVGFVNWSNGGNTSVSISALANASADFHKEKLLWENNLSIKGGISFVAIPIADTKTNPWRKTDDDINLKSRLNFILFDTSNHKLALSSAFSFLTQFTHGFQYGKATTPETGSPFPQYTEDIYTSNFLSPAYLKFTVGCAYHFNNFFSAYISPIGILGRFVIDDTLSQRESFGMEKGQKAKIELGAALSLEVSKELIKNLFLDHSSSIFVGYGRSTLAGFVSPLFSAQSANGIITFIYISETVFKFSFNNWFSTLLTFNFIYDNQNDKIVNSSTGEIGSFPQFKNAISIGISYAIKTSN